MSKTVLFLLLLSLLILAPVSAKSERAPYIYYHSTVLNGIVIERADGSDSRVIGTSLMPEEHVRINMRTGWSATGEWLAWTSAVYELHHRVLSYAWIVSTDGMRRIRLLDDVAGIWYMQWSPMGDYLFIIQNDSIPGFGQEDLDAYLIDVQNEEIITHFSDFYLEAPLETPEFWSADGQRVVLQMNPLYSDYNGNLQPAELIQRHIYMNGRIVDKETPEEVELYNPYPSSYVWTASFPSPNERYIASQDWTIEDTETNEIIQLRPASGDWGGLCAYDWHSSSEWLLHEANRRAAESGCGLGGVNVVSVDGRIQRELNECSLYRRYCAGWLPERVIHHLSSGQAQSVVPEPIVTIPHEGSVLGVAWCPDGNQLATFEEYRADSGYNYFLNIWQVNEDDVVLQSRISVERCYEHYFGDCVVHWHPTQPIIYLVNSETTQIVDLSTLEVIIGYNQAHDTDWWRHERQWMTDDEFSATITPLNNEDRMATLSLIAPDGSARDFNISQFYWIESFAVLEEKQDVAIVLEGYDKDSLIVWDYQFDSFIRPHAQNRVQFNELQISNDGETFVSFGKMGLMRLWNLADNTLLGAINRYVVSLDFSPDDRTIVTGSSTVAEIWDVETVTYPPSTQ